MSPKKAIELIQKYIHDDLSEREVEQLLNWLQDPDNKVVFEEQIELNYLLYRGENEMDTQKAYRELMARLRGPSARKTKWVGWFKYAAIFILLVGAGLYFYTISVGDKMEKERPVSVTLQLEDGQIQAIQQEGHEIIMDKSGGQIGVREGDTLVYDKNLKAHELVYNTLRVPRGKTFRLALADGTKILLNADSKITYPVSFLPDEKRRVELEGEAYFEVQKDSLRQFVVQTADQEVKVYGTTFNVKAYRDNHSAETVLVEGSVGISTPGEEIKLVPGEMAVAEKLGGIEIQEVDPAIYTAWTADRLIFQATDFETIIKTLERKFDVQIDNQYEELNKEQFTAQFNREKDIKQILELFAKSRSFQFDKKGSQITIYKSSL